MNYLHFNVFDPVLNSPDISESLKKGTRLTITRMIRRNARGMVQYY
jgi:hypothetical protein